MVPYSDVKRVPYDASVLNINLYGLLLSIYTALTKMVPYELMYAV